MILGASGLSSTARKVIQCLRNEVPVESLTWEVGELPGFTVFGIVVHQCDRRVTYPDLVGDLAFGNLPDLTSVSLLPNLCPFLL